MPAFTLMGLILTLMLIPGCDSKPDDTIEPPKAAVFKSNARIVASEAGMAKLKAELERQNDSSEKAEPAPDHEAAPLRKTLFEARKGFKTRIVKSGEPAGAPDVPDGKKFKLIRYKSQVGPLAAYVTPSPRDGKKHPAIVWITGGDNNSIGDVWTPRDPRNDQSAAAFREAGIVMMFPSQRGGNENPGNREGFFGEADDVLAATTYLAALPYVDADQIYLGGHSTGGTLAMLVGEYSDRYRAIFALGPVANVSRYRGAYLYCDVRNAREMRLRSPINWLESVKTPMYVFEGKLGRVNLRALE